MLNFAYLITVLLHSGDIEPTPGPTPNNVVSHAADQIDDFAIINHYKIVYHNIHSISN